MGDRLRPPRLLLPVRRAVFRGGRSRQEPGCWSSLHVAGLSVAARTSAFAFRDKTEDVRGIGKELGVATVLGGSVLKSGDRLRVTAQLIKTSDGLHLWSQGFDRSSSDIFAVQESRRRSAGTTRLLNTDSRTYDLAWLPGGKVVYFTSKGTLVMQDVVSLQRREITGSLPYPPDILGSLVASPDGRTLYYGARQIEANIWPRGRGGAPRRSDRPA